MKKVAELPRFTVITIRDDDNGYYIYDPVHNERLDITFKNPREVVQYAHAEYFLIWFD